MYPSVNSLAKAAESQDSLKRGGDNVSVTCPPAQRPPRDPNTEEPEKSRN